MGGCFSSSPPVSATSPASSPTADWRTTAADILPACEPVRLLGEGTFGTVVLVRERATSNPFAVKVMNKSHLVTESQLDSVILERRVLREAGPHPFVVECHSGFQTPDAVVLALEYVPGGDMYDLLKRHGCLQEHQARFYLAEIVVAVAELHRHNFVFRDLKLENILIDARGHVRLTDFGLAGQVPPGDPGHNAIFDISGTAIYQAPEMLAGTGHGPVVDWWALGVLAYVLLAGRPPFSNSSREALYESIKTHDVDLDGDERLQNLSDTGKNFISRLLDKDPKTRLGRVGLDATDVQKHPFFQDMDWGVVSRAELEPPLPPGLQPDEDGSRPDEVNNAHEKIASKVMRKHRPSRTKSGRLKTVLDHREYKMVRTASRTAKGRVSIGLDFGGTNKTAAGKTWTGTENDFGRVLSGEQAG